MTEQNENLMIREMQKQDLSEVAEIEKNIFSLPWSQQGFEDSLRQENTCYLVACAEEADITNVAVRENWRNCGVGSRMLRELMHCGERRGVKAYTLEVRESNQAALALYERLGFTSAGIRKNFYDCPRENAVIMWKYL